MKYTVKDTSVVGKMEQIGKLEIPQHFVEGGGGCVRRDSDFDPNTFFDILDRLSMKPGLVLDYCYFKSGIGGYPCLYAREKESLPFQDNADFDSWKKNNKLLSFILVDGSPEGFFQLAVFVALAHQFYLFWHSCYNDSRIIADQEALERLIEENRTSDFGVHFSDTQISSLRSVTIQPTVELEDEVAWVELHQFTKWGGLIKIRESFNRYPPHLGLEQFSDCEVEYDCGILF
jgi:hypothetical protein